MTGDWNPRVLYQFDKNECQVVRCSLTEYRGHRLVDVRVYYESDEGEFLPTKKGIAVSVDRIDELLTGVSKLKEALDGS